MVMNEASELLALYCTHLCELQQISSPLSPQSHRLMRALICNEHTVIDGDIGLYMFPLSRGDEHQAFIVLGLVLFHYSTRVLNIG